MKKDIIIVLLISACLIINIIATNRVYKKVYYNQKQRIFQIVLIWLIPFISGLLLMIFNSKSTPTNCYPNEEPLSKRLVKYDENNAP